MTVTGAALVPAAPARDRTFRPPPSAAASAAPTKGDGRTNTMGRRKQNCPQKTGLGGPEPGGLPASAAAPGGPEESTESTLDEQPERSKEQAAEQHEARSGAMSSFEALLADMRQNPRSQSLAEALGSKMLSATLMNPALISLNPSLYAMHLAQLQAAQQLLSQTPKLQQQIQKATLENLGAAQRKRRLTEEGSSSPKPSGLEVLNLSSSGASDAAARADSPLDLSGNHDLAKEPTHSPVKKMARLDTEDISPAMHPLTATAAPFPFFNPLMAAISPTDAQRLVISSSASPLVATTAGLTGSHAAEKSGSTVTSSPSLVTSSHSLPETPSKSSTSSRQSGASGSGRHSAWQSQWISRGPENTKDIFKCVWCKDSFSTLQNLTTHMKETKHFGSALHGSSPSSHVPPATPATGLKVHSPDAQLPGPPNKAGPVPSVQQPPNTKPKAPQTASTGAPPTQKPVRDILKEQLPLPRKLVRGQDVWLGRGEQQTKDILKCMWCGESFRTLDLMTKHMQETKHYTKVISQEQLVSWRSSEDGPEAPSSTIATSQPLQNRAAGSGSPSKQDHVSSVLTCKVCEVSYSTLKELSEHMVKNNHFKEQLTSRSDETASPSGSGSRSMSPGALPEASGQSKEKRKKALPVRKLLELERASQGGGGSEALKGLTQQATSSSASGKISCEKCNERILLHQFVDHIRQCVGPQSANSTKSTTAATTSSGTTPPPLIVTKSSAADEPAREGSKSILGSLEKMVQRNFGSKKSLGATESQLSILQRLGIDEGVDYSKPLIDPLAMLRNAQQSLQATQLASEGSFRPQKRSSPPTLVPASAGIQGHHSASDNFVKQTEEAAEVIQLKATEERCPLSGGSREAASPAPRERTKSVSPVSNSPSSPAAASPKSDAEDAVPSKADNQEKDCSDPAPAAEDANSSNEGSNNGNSSSCGEVKLAAASPSNEEEQKGGSRRKAKKSHPLAALQLLCDKAEKVPKDADEPGKANSGAYTGLTDPGAILAFSWACNQAVVNDSLLKCPFCDTPFITKGAYRHHLSKMHFVKEGQMPDHKLLLQAAGVSLVDQSGSESGAASPGPSGGAGDAKEDDNPQSKFHKYSQLAKQLSCSSQP